MIEYAAGSVMAAHSNLALAAHQLTDARRQNPEATIEIGAETARLILVSINALEAAANSLGLVAARGAANRCKAALKSYPPSPRGGFCVPPDSIQNLDSAMAQLNIAFADEISSRTCFVFAPKDAELLCSGIALFGNEISDSFPDAVEDCMEAAQCLAFGRYTGSVFHLMRAMESAVKQMAAVLSVANVEKEWGKLLSDIGKKIEDLPKGEVRDLWSLTHSHLYHVKQAWRNNTMHPKKTYTEGEARAVFDAVASFMRHLTPMVATAG